MLIDSRTILGKQGEELAARYLEKNGYRVVVRNFSSRLGEIDLIAEKKKELHFVEVKTRRDTHFVAPEEVVDWRKQDKMRKVAQFFLASSQSKFENHEMYLDVMAVIGPTDKGDYTLRHLIGAF